VKKKERGIILHLQVESQKIVVSAVGLCIIIGGGVTAKAPLIP
jgi:hypothetical protein